MIKRHHKTKHRSPEIPVSSFSDIAFLLIIFFILATTLMQVEGIVTEIPSGKKTQQQQEETNSVYLLADGGIRFNKKAVTLAGLRAKLDGLDLDRQTGNAKIVEVESADAVEYQAYFAVLSAISRAGGVVVIVKEEPAE